MFYSYRKNKRKTIESRNKSYSKNKRKMIKIEIKDSVKIIENRNKIHSCKWHRNIQFLL